MTINAFVDLAKNTELKNVTPLNEDTAALIGFINLGLLEIHERFALDTNEVIITIGSDGTVTNPYTMISTTEYQMPDNFMYLLSAYEEVSEGAASSYVAPLPINDPHNEKSINTIRYNRIQVPYSAVGANISLIYVPAPIYFTINDMDKVLPLPPQLFDVLLAYVGWRGYDSLNPGRQESQALEAKYEKAIARAKEHGVITADDMTMDDKFYNSTFV